MLLRVIKAMVIEFALFHLCEYALLPSQRGLLFTTDSSIQLNQLMQEPVIRPYDATLPYGGQSLFNGHVST